MGKIFSEHDDGIKISITDNCINCSKCIEVCPIGVLTQNNNKSSKKPAIFDRTVCIRCGHCIAICPKDAIVHSELPQEEFTEIIKTEPIVWEQFNNFTKQRRSIRQFSDKPVPSEIIKIIINESARYSPSGHNRQITRIIILEGDILKKIRNEMNITIVRLYNYLKVLHYFSSKLEIKWKNMRSFKNMIENGMDPSTRDAPLAMIFCADKSIKESEVDASILSYQTLLSAEILGLKTCYFGALINILPYSGKLKKMLKLRPDEKICCGLLIGYSNIKYKKNVFRKKIEYDYLK